MKLWRSIAKQKELLCVECIQRRLGRKLDEADFPDHKTSIYDPLSIHNPREIICNIEFFEAYGLFQNQR